MKKSLLLFFKCIFKTVLIILSLLNLKNSTVLAQFDSLIWINRYSNHSVCSRDNVKKVLFINKENLYISGTTESDYTDFDVTTIRLDNDVNLVWEKSYSSLGNSYSYDQIKDIAVDSSGNVFVIGSSETENRIPFLIKRDKEGNLLWNYSFLDLGSPDVELGICDLETDKSGNCYLIAGINSFSSDNSAHTMIFKFDINGKISWYKKTSLYYPQKIFIDDNQDILTINNNDEVFNWKIILQKYNTDGDLLFDQRDSKMRGDVLFVKTDAERNTWLFSDLVCYNSKGMLSSDIQISKYDSLGNLVKEVIYDSKSDIKKKLKFVQSGYDSTFIIGIDSYTINNGIDNQLIRINSDLQITDSLSYDSEFHNNDYLISFDQTDKNDIIVTGITYVDAYKFFPVVYKVKNFEQIEWIKIPSISDTTEVYPKSVFVDKLGSILLVGDAEMTVNPEVGNTHSNIFISKFDPSGVEILTREFGAGGKSDIEASVVSLDSENNIYVSGIEQLGPIYLYPTEYPDQNIFMNKYNSDGVSEWNKKIDLKKGAVGYLHHFITADSIITVIVSSQGKTSLYKFNKNGIISDSIEIEGNVRTALRDNQGNFILFLWKSSDILILKIKQDLTFDKSYLIPNSSLPLRTAILNKNSIYFVAGNSSQYLYKYDQDLNQIWQFCLTAYIQGLFSLVTDSLQNIFVTGTDRSLLKINPGGAVEWVKKINVANAKIGVQSTGFMVLCGSDCGTSACAPSIVTLISDTGNIIKSISVPFYVDHFLIDRNDLIYLFDLKNNYHVYTPVLDIIRHDSFAEKSKGYDYYFNDIKLDSDNNIIIAGSNGVGWYSKNGLYSWKTLAVAKIAGVGKVNSSPCFLNNNIEVQLHPGDKIHIEFPAVDYDKDTITYTLLTHYDWIDLDRKTGTMAIETQSTDPLNFYEVSITASDNYGHADTNRISVKIANEPPYFKSLPVTKVTANNKYSYSSSAIDPDEDYIYYRISQGPAWLQIDNTGLVTGSPASQDLGTFQIIIMCYDNYGGEGIQKYNLQVTNIATSVEEDILSGDELKIYPIPASHCINIVSNQGPMETSKIIIVDAKGTMIREFSTYSFINEDTIKLDIDGITSGIYNILIYSKNKVYCKRIIILQYP